MKVSDRAPCTPLEFSVDLQLPQELPLDEVVCTSRQVINYGRVSFYGVLDSLDMQNGYRAKIRITRTEPEIFVALSLEHRWSEPMLPCSPSHSISI